MVVSSLVVIVSAFRGHHGGGFGGGPFRRGAEKQDRLDKAICKFLLMRESW